MINGFAELYLRNSAELQELLAYDLIRVDVSIIKNFNFKIIFLIKMIRNIL